MRLSLIALIIVAAVLTAQTPLEFGIVQDLVGGTPRVSVFSIKTRSIEGVNTLQIAARAGIQFNCTRHSMLADSMTSSDVLIEGQICYTASIAKATTEHFFSVIRDNMSRHGSGGISQFQVEFITGDEMGWISATIPLTRVDSLLSGLINHLDFWAISPFSEVEIGTGGFPVINDSPLPELHGAPVSVIAVEAIEEKNHAWKSLVMPGWGQFSSGTGTPLLNIVAELGGVALLFTDEYSEVGIGVLALNHLISFSDLL